mgnify:CR=1 FL=1
MCPASSWRSHMERSSMLLIPHPSCSKTTSWPDQHLVGVAGATGAWLIAQHADHDVAFQKMCLKLLNKKCKEGAASRQHVAYLADRIRVNRGLPQWYGTQFRLNSDNRLAPWPIQDKQRLRARREKMGFGPFSAYQKKLMQIQKRKSDT